LATVGARFTIDVNVSDLPAGLAIAAYDLDAVFDPAVIAGSEVIFGAALGVVGVDQFTNAVLSVGRIDFAAVSLLDEAALFALQPGSFTIAQLVFDALAPGLTAIEFDIVTAPGLFFGDQFGNVIAVSIGSEAMARIVGPIGVPEPASLILGITALLGVFAISAGAGAGFSRTPA
jgi:hypothetical protein